MAPVHLYHPRPMTPFARVQQCPSLVSNGTLCSRPTAPFVRTHWHLLRVPNTIVCSNSAVQARHRSLAPNDVAWACSTAPYVRLQRCHLCALNGGALSHQTVLFASPHQHCPLVFHSTACLCPTGLFVHLCW
jgi:hypothetical protein